jgi:hypothetical protein
MSTRIERRSSPRNVNRAGMRCQRGVPVETLCKRRAHKLLTLSGREAGISGILAVENALDQGLQWGFGGLAAP